MHFFISCKRFETLFKVEHFKGQLTLAAAATSVSSAGLSRMVGEDLHQQFVAGLLELVNHSVVQGVFVLLKPSSEVVGHLNYNGKF